MLAGIETDKAVVDFELQEEGYIAAILYEDGAKDVELGKVLAVLVENEEDIPAFANYDPDASAAPAAPQAAPAEPTPAAATPAAAPQ